MEKQKDFLEFSFPNYEKIQCKNCKYSNGTILRTCLKYQVKPRDVYYENAECPKFEPKKGMENEE